MIDIYVKSTPMIDHWDDFSKNVDNNLSHSIKNTLETSFGGPEKIEIEGSILSTLTINLETEMSKVVGEMNLKDVVYTTISNNYGFALERSVNEVASMHPEDLL